MRLESWKVIIILPILALGAEADDRVDLRAGSLGLLPNSLKRDTELYMSPRR